LPPRFLSSTLGCVFFLISSNGISLSAYHSSLEWTFLSFTHENSVRLLLAPFSSSVQWRLLFRAEIRQASLPFPATPVCFSLPCPNISLFPMISDTDSNAVFSRPFPLSRVNTDFSYVPPPVVANAFFFRYYLDLPYYDGSLCSCTFSFNILYALPSSYVAGPRLTEPGFLWCKTPFLRFGTKPCLFWVQSPGVRLRIGTQAVFFPFFSPGN